MFFGSFVAEVGIVAQKLIKKNSGRERVRAGKKKVGSREARAWRILSRKKRLQQLELQQQESITEAEKGATYCNQLVQSEHIESTPKPPTYSGYDQRLSHHIYCSIIN